MGPSAGWEARLQSAYGENGEEPGLTFEEFLPSSPLHNALNQSHAGVTQLNNQKEMKQGGGGGETLICQFVGCKSKIIVI